MTELTREQLEAMLDGATQGPWQADGEPWNRIVWSSAENRVCFMAHTNGLDDARDIATSDLVAAAPDLARQLLATMTERDEAQAAQASVVERACLAVSEQADWPEDEHGRTEQPELFARVINAIRSLADPTGVKLLAELRAEIEALKTDLASYMDAANEYARGEDDLRAQLAEAQKREATETARADAAEALVAGLRAGLLSVCEYEPDERDNPLVVIMRMAGLARAALATQEAGNG